MDDDVTKQGGESAEKLTRRGFLGMAASMTAAATATALPQVVNAATGKGEARDVLDVAIIGAGLAGLTAARDLRRAGCESFVVLEARDRVGGRTLNHDLGKGYFSEAGGQWIGPGQTAVADLARELGVGTFPTYWQGETTLLAAGARASIDTGGGFGTDPKIAHELEKLAKSVPSGRPGSRRVRRSSTPCRWETGWRKRTSRRKTRSAGQRDWPSPAVRRRQGFHCCIGYRWSIRLSVTTIGWRR